MHASPYLIPLSLSQVEAVAVTYLWPPYDVLEDPPFSPQGISCTAKLFEGAGQKGARVTRVLPWQRWVGVRCMHVYLCVCVVVCVCACMRVPHRRTRCSRTTQAPI